MTDDIRLGGLVNLGWDRGEDQSLRLTTTISRTNSELSIVAPSSAPITSPKSDSDWVMFVFEGTLDFSLTGILAGIAQPLAAVGVSIFAISTFDTDYVMVKQNQKGLAEATLIGAGYQFN